MHNLIDIILNNNNNHCNNTMFIDNVGKYMLTPWFKAEYVDSCNIPPPPLPLPLPPPLPSSKQPSNHVEKMVPFPVPSIYSRLPIIYPTQKDTLFWCICIAGGDYTDYLNITHNYGVRSLEIKYKINEFIKNNISKFTDKKITKIAIQEMSSELITNRNTTSLQCVIGMIMYFNINVIIIDATDKLIMEFISSTEHPTHLLKTDKYGKYSIDLNIMTPTEIEQIKNVRIKLESFKKPLKTISNYKLDELIKMVTIMDIECDVHKCKKNELYALLVQNVKCI